MSCYELSVTSAAEFNAHVREYHKARHFNILDHCRLQTINYISARRVNDEATLLWDDVGMQLLIYVNTKTNVGILYYLGYNIYNIPYIMTTGFNEIFNSRVWLGEIICEITIDNKL